MIRGTSPREVLGVQFEHPYVEYEQVQDNSVPNHTSVWFSSKTILFRLVQVRLGREIGENRSSN